MDSVFSVLIYFPSILLRPQDSLAAIMLKLIKAKDLSRVRVYLGLHEETDAPVLYNPNFFEYSAKNL